MVLYGLMSLILSFKVYSLYWISYRSCALRIGLARFARLLRARCKPSADGPMSSKAVQEARNCARFTRK